MHLSHGSSVRVIGYYTDVILYYPVGKPDIISSLPGRATEPCCETEVVTQSFVSDYSLENSHAALLWLYLCHTTSTTWFC